MSEVLKSEINYFAKQNYQGSIDTSQIVRCSPVSSLADGSTIEFVIKTSQTENIDLQLVLLSLNGKLVKDDNSNYIAADDNNYSLINYALNTMFDQLDIYLNNVLISQSSNTYHYRSFIEAICDNTKNSMETFMKSAGFVMPGDTDTYDYDGIDANLHANVKRSRDFHLFGILHGDIFNSDRLLINGMELKLIFNKAKMNVCTMGATNYKPKIHLTQAIIYVRKVKLLPNVLNASEERLKSQKALYPIKRTLVKEINLPSGQSNFNLDNIFMGQMPCKLILGIVSHNANSGSYQHNPLAFKNYDLKFLCVHINGETFPNVAYEPNYNNDLYIREYFEFFLNEGFAPYITFIQYKKGLCLYSFNFNADFNNSNEIDYINIPKEGFMNIEIKFRANLTDALKCICFAKFDNIIEIDENRNVFVDY